MIIKSCNIRGFGCFTGKRFDFSEGLNVFLEENGYGKTTLTAFLRVMFYGFRYEGKKTGRERELRRPWQASEYGGSIDFELNGKIYRIDRRFGKKSAEDDLKVYDLDTLMPAKEFFDPIGLKLFGVDSETFERTIYVSDANISTYISDGVHAKIGDLVDDTVDVNRYTKAADLLNGEITRLSESRKTGELYKLRDRITYLSQDVNVLDSIEARYETADRQLKEALDKQKKILDEQADIRVKISQIADYKTVEDKINKYNDLEKTLKERRKDLNDARSYFAFGMPDSYDLQNAQQSFSRYEARESIITETITQEELDQLRKLEQVYQYIELSDDEQNSIVQLSEDCQADRANLSDISSKMEQLDIEKTRTEEQYKKKSAIIIPSIIVLVAGAGLVAAGLLLYKVALTIPGVVLVIAGVMGIVLFLTNRRAVSAASEELSKKQEVFNKEQQQLYDQLSQGESKLNTFFMRFQSEYNPDSSTVDLFKIFNEYKTYKSLKQKQQGQRKAIEEREIEEAVVKNFVDKYAPNDGSNYGAILRAISKAMEQYEGAYRDFSRAKEAFSNYEKQIDIESLKVVEKPAFSDSLDDLSNRIRELDNEKTEIDRTIDMCRRNEEDSRTRLETVQEERDELDGLVETQRELLKRVSILKKTAELLERAKTSFSLKMTDPVTKRFQEYLSRILKEDITGFRIDVAGKVVLEKEGAIHNIDLMSSGYQALTYFCLRLALVDEMYKEEQPLIILDDPFPSLDEDKLQNAKELVQEAAQRYQILYFTCHESRSFI